jgi:hypothetical protein
MGKSTTLSEHGPLVADGAQIRTLTVDLAAFSSEERLVRKLLEGQEITDWLAGDSEVCLTLDSFDEAHVRIKNLHLLMAEYLDEWDCERLILRIACRTADWPAPLEALLERKFGDVARYELLPLQRSDAAALVSPMVESPEEFLVAVEYARAVPLASRPLTLKLLAASFQKEGTLPDRACDVYERGLLALCEEMNPERRGADIYAAFRPRSRLEAASRIAAFSVFGDRPTFWQGPVVEAGATDLTIDDCSWTSSPLSVYSFATAEAIAAALRTGIFTGGGTQRLTWSHATFADYLAARWIVQHGLNRDQVTSLLVSLDGKPYPRVRRVAAWIVAMAPNDFSWLISTDPEAFLLDVGLPEGSLRALVVAAVLSEAAKGAIYHDFSRDYSGLQHPLLADQLRHALRGDHSETTRIAISIARQCQVIDVLPELSAIALDPNAEPPVRVAAAWATQDLSSANPGGRLLPLLEPSAELGGDPHQAQELLAAGLMASWPHGISTVEVFALLAPKQPKNYYGLYSIFVNKFAASLTAQDLHSACKWLAGNTNAVGDTRLAHLVESVVALSLEHLDQPEALATVKLVALHRAREHEPLTRADSFEGELEVSSAQRRTLILAILSDCDEQSVFSFVESSGASGPCVVGTNDFDWLVNEYAGAAGLLRENLAQVIALVHVPDNREHIDTVLDLPEQHPATPLFAYWRDPVVIDSPEAEEARSRLNRRAELTARMSAREKEKEATDLEVNEGVSKFAAEAKDGNTDAFWRAVRLVTVRPGSKRYLDEHQPDLTGHPRWQTLAPQTKEDLLDAAGVYLRHGHCKSEEWLTSDRRSFPAEAGYRALLLLLRIRPQELDDLDSMVWREWAPILVSWRTTVNGARAEDKERLLKLALVHARQELTATLLQLVDAAIAADDHTFLRDELELLYSPALEEALLARLRAESIPEKPLNDILDVLTRNQSGAARSLLTSWLDQQGREAYPARARQAALRLFRSDVRGSWETLWELMKSNPDFMKDAFLATDHEFYRRSPHLDETHLSDLYTWLVEHFPPSEDPSFQEVHFVGPRESLAAWRNSIPETLSKRGTRASVAAVAQLVEARPGQTWLKYLLIDARQAFRDNSWAPLTHQELDRLSADSESRLIRTELDLFQASLAALQTIQSRLQGDTPSAPLLWDSYSKRPKSEDEVSDYLRNELQSLLLDRGAIVNREVQVRRVRPTGLSERTDIRFDATNQGAAKSPADQITVVAEVKGCWNDGIFGSIQSQLVNRYMADLQSICGIYIAVWFDLESWTRDDSRRAKAAAHGDREELRLNLEARAAQETRGGRRVAVVILDASLRRPPPPPA